MLVVGSSPRLRARPWVSVGLSLSEAENSRDPGNSGLSVGALLGAKVPGPSQHTTNFL